MAIERKDPSRFFTTGDTTPTEMADLDFKIRSGLCPNSCDRLLEPADSGGYHCSGCNFWTNSKPESERGN